MCGVPHTAEAEAARKLEEEGKAGKKQAARAIAWAWVGTCSLRGSGWAGERAGGQQARSLPVDRSGLASGGIGYRRSGGGDICNVCREKKRAMMPGGWPTAQKPEGLAQRVEIFQQ